MTTEPPSVRQTRHLEAVLPPMTALGVIEANTLEEQLRT